MNKLFCIIFKTSPDSMQLLVNPKLLRFKGVSYPEEGANTDHRVPGTLFDRRKEKKKKKSTPPHPPNCGGTRAEIYYCPMH